MRQGEFNTFFRVERKGDDLGLGIPLPYQPTGLTLWAAVEQLSGGELAVAQALEARANVLVRTHWQPGLQVKDRLVDRASGRVLAIVALHNVLARNEELRLSCVEVVT